MTTQAKNDKQAQSAAPVPAEQAAQPTRQYADPIDEDALHDQLALAMGSDSVHDQLPAIYDHTKGECLDWPLNDPAVPTPATK